MDDKELNVLKTDIALIKRDISQIEKFFVKIENSIDNVSHISKNMAVQERIVSNLDDRIVSIDEKLARYIREESISTATLNTHIDDAKSAMQNAISELRKYNEDARELRHAEIMNMFNEVRSELRAKTKDHDARLKTLEAWKWWVMGIGITIVSIASLAWKSLFG